MNALTGLGLTTGPLHDVLVYGALAALVALFVLRRDRAWWLHVVPPALAGTAVLLGVTSVWLDKVKPWPDALPADVWAWVGAGELAMVLAALGWRHRSWPFRLLTIGAVALTLAGAADGINTVYGFYPTVATAFQLPPTDDAPSLASVSWHPAAQIPATAAPLWAWHPPAGLPVHGAVFSVHIPATSSHFAARSAWVYVPPAYLVTTRPRLPVLVLIAGQPGGPRDWLDGGRLAERMDAWAASHSGLAPVVVMPDVSGSVFADPLCMNSALGRVDTYLTSDVIRWVTGRLDIDPGATHWAAGGFSSGGTCALQLATAHPDLFPTFFDASGEEGPSLGDRRKTIAATFHGNTAAFVAVSPLQELAHERYPTSAGYLAVGSGDTVYGPQQAVVARAARAAGMTIVDVHVAGRHSFQVWGPALSAAMPWLAARLGLVRDHAQH